MRTRIKVCGVKDKAIAEAVVNAGADAIGMMFYLQSKRYVDIEKATHITDGLPPMITKVGVWVNADYDEVVDVVTAVPLDVLQFHGDEDETFCSSFGIPYIKAIRVHRETDIEQIELEYSTASALLLDTHMINAYGGTGETFDWKMAERVRNKSVILAGGLDVDNIQQAIRSVSPYGVDVSSGVETNSQKDSEKIIEFCCKVHQMTHK